jgi:cell division protein FtsW (lipid II flippase)
MLKLSRPYNLFLPVALLFIILVFFISTPTVDFHVYDTMFVVAGSSVIWLVAAFLALFWVLYRLTYHLLYSSLLTWLHVLFTIIALVAVFTLIKLQPSHTEGWAYYEQFTGYEKRIAITVLLALITQLVYPVNLVIGIIKKGGKRIAKT